MGESAGRRGEWINDVKIRWLHGDVNQEEEEERDGTEDPWGPSSGRGVGKEDVAVDR